MEDVFYNLKKCALGALQEEKWIDCRFLVGSDPSNQKIITGHKLILAMVSPVFERMFYGELSKNEDPIIVPDIQPEAFEAMLMCIYSDAFHVKSFDEACGLCYAANKYMLRHVEERCILYFNDNLRPKNACRTYELAKLLDKPNLMESSMKIIAEHTLCVLADPSFKEIEESTLMTILDEDELNISSEMDLFKALILFANNRCESRYGVVTISHVCNTNLNRNNSKIKKNNSFNDNYRKLNDYIYQNHSYEHQNCCTNCFCYNAPSSDLGVKNKDSSELYVSQNEEPAALTVSNDQKQTTSSFAASSVPDLNSSVDAQLKKALKKIRFLTMKPHVFAEGPARSKLLQLNEAFSIFMNICSFINDYPMPDGFCISRIKRKNKS